MSLLYIEKWINVTRDSSLNSSKSWDKKLLKMTKSVKILRSKTVIFSVKNGHIWPQLGLIWPLFGPIWPQLSPIWPLFGPIWPLLASIWPLLASIGLNMAVTGLNRDITGLNRAQYSHTGLNRANTAILASIPIPAPPHTPITRTPIPHYPAPHPMAPPRTTGPSMATGVSQRPQGVHQASFVLNTRNHDKQLDRHIRNPE